MRKVFLAVALVAFLPTAAADAAKPRDRDRDGLPDRWERTHRARAASADLDRDRLTNRAEFRAQTDPRRRDSDADGTHDGAEGAGRIAAVSDGTVTIELGASSLRGRMFAPLASIASGRRITAAAPPEAFVCGDPEEWEDVRGGARVRDTDAEEAEGDEDELGGDEPLLYSADLDDAPELIEDTIPAEGDPEGDADDEAEDEELTDACPPGAIAVGAWVRELEISVSREAGTELEEVVLAG